MLENPRKMAASQDITSGNFHRNLWIIIRGYPLALGPVQDLQQETSLRMCIFMFRWFLQNITRANVSIESILWVGYYWLLANGQVYRTGRGAWQLMHAIRFMAEGKGIPSDMITAWHLWRLFSSIKVNAMCIKLAALCHFQTSISRCIVMIFFP